MPIFLKSLQNNVFALEPWTCHDAAELDALVARQEAHVREGIQAKRAKTGHRFAASNSVPEKRPSAPGVSISAERIREEERARLAVLDECLSSESNPLARKVLIAAKTDGRSLRDCYGALLQIYGTENWEIENFRNLFNPQSAVVAALNDPDPYVRLFAETYGASKTEIGKAREKEFQDAKEGKPSKGAETGQDDPDAGELDSMKKIGEKLLGLKSR